MFVSWLHPFKEQRLVVVGSEAMAVFDDTQPWEQKLLVFEHGVDWSDGRPRPARAEPGRSTSSRPSRCGRRVRALLGRRRSGSTPRTDGHEGLRVLRVLARAQASLGEFQGASAPP
ncbi:MAG: hypothetical protein R2701_03460 [Acidimicrobiales bacterium]